MKFLIILLLGVLITSESTPWACEKEGSVYDWIKTETRSPEGDHLLFIGDQPYVVVCGCRQDKEDDSTCLLYEYKYKRE